MAKQEKMSKAELEKVTGGMDSRQVKKFGELDIEDLLKGVVQIKHDVNGDYSERVCKYCGKTFRCAEYAYAGKMTSEQALRHRYDHEVCSECKKIYPFDKNKSG